MLDLNFNCSNFFLVQPARRSSMWTASCHGSPAILIFPSRAKNVWQGRPLNLFCRQGLIDRASVVNKKKIVVKRKFKVRLSDRAAVLSLNLALCSAKKNFDREEDNVNRKPVFILCLARDVTAYLWN